MKELGIEKPPAYSPQARELSERSFQTWQGRLPQELRLAGITGLDQANAFLTERYIAAFNQKFSVPAAQAGTAFVGTQRANLDRVFSIHHERRVEQDNTVRWASGSLQIEPQRWRSTLAGCRIVIYEALDGTLTLAYGPHIVGRFTADDEPLVEPKSQQKAGTRNWPRKKGGPIS